MAFFLMSLLGGRLVEIFFDYLSHLSVDNSSFVLNDAYETILSDPEKEFKQSVQAFISGVCLFYFADLIVISSHLRLEKLRPS